MRCCCLGLCLLLCLGTSTVNAQTAEWTVWIVTSPRDSVLMTALRSDGAVVSEIPMKVPEGYTQTGSAGISYSGRYRAYYVFQDKFPPAGDSAIAVYDVIEDNFPVIYLMPTYYWSSETLVFDEAETRFSLGYNVIDPETNWPNGWRLKVFDLQTGAIIAELGNKDEEDCIGCSPVVKRFADDVVTFHLTNRQIEDIARPLAWNIETGDVNHDPAYDYHNMDVFPPTGEVIFGRYDERFPIADTGPFERPLDYFAAPNTLWIARDGKLFPFFTTPDWWTTVTRFIQNGERVLSGGFIRGGSGLYQFAIINRDGSIAADYAPDDNLEELQFAATPDGFVEFHRLTSTVYHVNTSGAEPIKEQIGSFNRRGWLSHVEYHVPAGDWGEWQDLAPEN